MQFVPEWCRKIRTAERQKGAERLDRRKAQKGDLGRFFDGPQPVVALAPISAAVGAPVCTHPLTICEPVKNSLYSPPPFLFHRDCPPGIVRAAMNSRKTPKNVANLPF